MNDLQNIHQINGRVEGDWVLYECPFCDYKRKFNMVTGQMKSNAAARESLIRHQGYYSAYPELINVQFGEITIQNKPVNPAIQGPFNLN